MNRRTTGLCLWLSACAWLAPGAADERSPRLRIGGSGGSGAIDLTWPTTTATVYRLERTAQLAAPVWQAIGVPHVGDGLPVTIGATTMSTRTAYYRLALPDVQVVYASAYGACNGDTLAAALRDAGTGLTLLRLERGPWDVANSICIPSNVLVSIEAGCLVRGSGTLTFQGGMLADSRRRVFGTDLAVQGLRQGVRPEWWGLATNADESVNAPALTRAVRAADGSAIWLPEGAYRIGILYLAATNVVIRGYEPATPVSGPGAGSGGTRLAGVLRLSGMRYGLERLSVVFAPGTPDPLAIVEGCAYRVDGCSFVGDRSAAANRHNLFLKGTNGVVANVEVRDGGGHGLVSKSTGLLAENIRAENCQWGITIKSGGGVPPTAVSSNVFRDVVVTGHSVTSDYGMVIMAADGIGLTGVSVTGLSVSNVYMGVDIEANAGAVMRDVAVRDATVADGRFGYRVYMSSPAVMTNVALTACRAWRCTGVGYLQQASGAWVDVLASQAEDCARAVAGAFRTAEVAVVTSPAAAGLSCPGR